MLVRQVRVVVASSANELAKGTPITEERRLEIHNLVQAKLSDQEGFIIIYCLPSNGGTITTCTTNMQAACIPNLMLDVAHAMAFGRLRVQYEQPPPQETPDGG